MSLPEVLLWKQLRSPGVEGLRFRRQHPIGPYVLDFFCAEASLAVEVDGWSHNAGDRPVRDIERDEWLRTQGLRVLRLSATDVLKQMDDVVRTIWAAARGEL